jgi:hypothetical protein
MSSNCVLLGNNSLLQALWVATQKRFVLYIEYI